MSTGKADRPGRFRRVLRDARVMAAIALAFAFMTLVVALVALHINREAIIEGCRRDVTVRKAYRDDLRDRGRDKLVRAVTPTIIRCEDRYPRFP